MNEQLDLFVSVMGRLPDFIDGHQHVHTFPVIRDVFIAVIQNRFQDNLPYVRSISPMLHTANSGPKALVVQGISSGFAQALDRYRIQHNTAFGGMYNLTVEKPYRQFMKRWLQEAPSGTMIMCHPGKESAQTTTDPHPEARVQEYTYFSSDVFQEDCALAGVILKRLSHL